MGTVFASNSTITKFNELYFFENAAMPGRAFYQNSNLRELSIPKKMTALTGGTAAFNALSNLKIYCPEGLTSMPYASFNNCSNTTIVLPSTMTSIVNNALYSGSYTIICKSITPPDMVGNTNRISAVYVPDESVAAYKAADTWSAIASKIYPLSQYEGSVVSPVWWLDP